MSRQVLKHYNVEIVEEWDNDCDWYIYEEPTADGYSVFVSTNNTNNTIVQENIFYYDSDLGDVFAEKVMDEDVFRIYVDDPTAYWVVESLSDLKIHLQNKKMIQSYGKVHLSTVDLVVLMIIQ